MYVFSFLCKIHTFETNPLWTDSLETGVSLFLLHLEYAYICALAFSSPIIGYHWLQTENTDAMTSSKQATHMMLEFSVVCHRFLDLSLNLLRFVLPLPRILENSAAVFRSNVLFHVLLASVVDHFTFSRRKWLLKQIVLLVVVAEMCCLLTRVLQE